MVAIELVGDETGDQLIKKLAALRYWSRRILRKEKETNALRATWHKLLEQPDDEAAAATARRCVGECDEWLLDCSFAVIEIGNFLVPLCEDLDRKASRNAVLDALEVNESDRSSDMMLKYGDRIRDVISVLDLENSATKDDDIATKPLKWCQTMAFMHAMTTSDKFDRTVHEKTNEFFDGAFGEYRERPLTERLAGRAV